MDWFQQGLKSKHAQIKNGIEDQISLNTYNDKEHIEQMHFRSCQEDKNTLKCG